MNTKIKFVHATRPTAYLIKVTARVGDDLWMLTNLEMPVTDPTTREKALRYLTPENGWTMVEEPCEYQDFQVLVAAPTFETRKGIILRGGPDGQTGPNYTLPVKFSATNRYGNGPKDEDDVYTVAEFLETVETGGFIDYDGFGHPVKDGLADEGIWVKPSKPHEIPKDATHIVWYNR